MDKKRYTQKYAEKSIKNFVSYLEKEHNLPVERVYLFGSYAKNKQHEWSDIDVCIISSFFENNDSLSYLWPLRRKKDVHNMLAPIGIPPKDFKSKSPSPLIWQIKKTGKRIT